MEARRFEHVESFVWTRAELGVKTAHKLNNGVRLIRGLRSLGRSMSIELRIEMLEATIIAPSAIYVLNLGW